MQHPYVQAATHVATSLATGLLLLLRAGPSCPIAPPSGACGALPALGEPLETKPALVELSGYLVAFLLAGLVAISLVFGFLVNKGLNYYVESRCHAALSPGEPMAERRGANVGIHPVRRRLALQSEAFPRLGTGAAGRIGWASDDE